MPLVDVDLAIDTAIDAADEWDCDFSFERDRKIRDAFMALPTVDAVPVVHCRDCKYWDTFPSSSLAPDHHECKRIRIHTTAEWFCAAGERKNGDNEND